MDMAFTVATLSRRWACSEGAIRGMTVPSALKHRLAGIRGGV